MDKTQLAHEQLSILTWIIIVQRAYSFIRAHNNNKAHNRHNRLKLKYKTTARPVRMSFHFDLNSKVIQNMI